MRTIDGLEINDLYAGGQQDIFVLCMLGTSSGTFLDIGCREPLNHSNTALLEKYGWSGIGLDLQNYSDLWKKFRPLSNFVHANAILPDYEKLFEEYNLQDPIDYLSIDLDGRGIAFECLKKVLNSGYEFKVLTIEHDAYSGNVESDMLPQRELLLSKGYVLVRPCDYIEDFWINPNYVSIEDKEQFFYQNTTDKKEIHFWEHCKNIKFDFTSFYE
jgi:hypothetical protein